MALLDVLANLDKFLTTIDSKIPEEPDGHTHSDEPINISTDCFTFQNDIEENIKQIRTKL